MAVIIEVRRSVSRQSPRAMIDRNEAIYREYVGGKQSLADLAAKHGVTKQRVHQIIKRMQRKQRGL